MKVTLGPSRDGIVKNIRKFALVRDSDSCEHAKIMPKVSNSNFIQYTIGGTTAEVERTYTYGYTPWN